MTELLIPSFIAGFFMFIAPCTLPLVPTYLVFIAGTSIDTLQRLQTNSVRRKIIINSLMYVLGFSLIFILLGTALAWGGSFLTAHRLLLARIGGIFVIIFGVFMLEEAWLARVGWLSFLFREKRFNIFNKLRPGKPWSAFIFGVTFAFGWTPCIGPILGSVLLLAATTATAWSGALLLAVFSLGMAVPFLIISFAFNSIFKRWKKIHKYLAALSLVGGLFLIFIGILMITDRLGIWTTRFVHDLTLPI